MAPALTEPLSPKEQLSDSAITASTSPAVTDFNNKLDTSNKVSFSVTTANHKVRGDIIVNSRVTRSKDSTIQQHTSGIPILIRRNLKSNNDEMGLSTARNSNNPVSNNNNNVEKVSVPTAIIDNTKQQQAPALSCKDNSTEQLLADLTDDFEEAITAEIYLRKQLPEVTLNKESTSDTVANRETSIVATTTIGEVNVGYPFQTTNSSSSETATIVKTVAAVLNSAQQHMEVESLDTPEVTENIFLNNVEPLAAEKSTALKKVQPIVADTEKDCEEQPTCSHVSANKLPSLSSDSTISASEIEDNLEERLSQLDGNALPPPAPLPVGVYSSSVEAKTPTRQLYLMQQQSPTAFTTAELINATNVASSLVPMTLTSTPQSTTSTLSNVSLSQNFLKENNTGDELGDFEEVLKVLKGFDTTQNSDSLVDLNTFINEVLQMPNCEEPTQSQPIISDQEEIDNVTDQQHNMTDQQYNITEQQRNLNIKLNALLQRLRKLQARYMCRHASAEISGLFEWSARISNKVSHPVHSTKLTEHENTLLDVVAGKPPASFWDEQKQSHLSSAQMHNVLNHIAVVANEQQLCTELSTTPGAAASINLSHHARRNKKQMDLLTPKSSSNAPNIASSNEQNKIDEVVPPYDSYVTSEMDYVSGLMHTEMREVQNAMDSDATESSSGGESADEMINYNNTSQQTLAIRKRAVWRFSRDRASIALRWSWLISRIHDLNLKIRHYDDLQHELNRTEGEVVLETTPTKPIVNQNSNGYATKTLTTVNASSNIEMGSELCSRTRALLVSDFRKRKLLQTINMHTISKKATRPSDLKCGCQWPLLPCALCTGRADPTAPRALPGTIMRQNRVALLDPGYHPVLSFPEDIPQSVYFESICRQPDWQYRTMRCQFKTITKNLWKAEREATMSHFSNTTGRKHAADGSATKRRYVRRKERNNNNNDSSKLAATTSTVGGIPNSRNGTACSSTPTTTTPTSTTPLVANKVKKERHSRNNSFAQQIPNYSQQHQQMSNVYPLEKIYSTNQHKPQTHATLISNSNNKKSVVSSTSNNSMNQNIEATTNKYNQFKAYGDSNFLNSSDQCCDNGKVFELQQTKQSRISSPTPTTNNCGVNQQRSTDRRNRIFDIDNIVIPYSIAATRVEVLPYKEIPIPKWRVIDNNNEEKVEKQPAKEDDHSEKKQQQLVIEKQPSTSNVINTTMQFENSNEEERKQQKSQKFIAKPIVNKRIEKNSIKVNGALLLEQSAIALNKEVETVIAHDAMENKKAEANKERLGTTQNSAIIETATNETLKQIGKGKINGNITKEPEKRQDIKKQGKNDMQLKKICNVLRNNISSSSKVNSSTSNENQTENNQHENGENKKGIINKKYFTKTATVTTEAAKSVEKGKKIDYGKDTDSEKDKLMVKDNVNTLMLPAAINKSNRIVKESGNKCKGDNDVIEPALLEDISDEAYIARHQRALEEERRRFMSYASFSFSSRPRANRRVDSRAESSGTNTPISTSPGPHTTHTSDCLPSPLAHSVTHNLLDADILSKLPQQTQQCKRQERRRTTSLKQKEQEPRSMTPELQPMVKPYEPLQFPLSDEVYAQIMKEAEESLKRKRIPLVNIDSMPTTSARSSSINRDYMYGVNAGKRSHSSKSTNCDVNNSNSIGGGNGSSYAAIKRKKICQTKNGKIKRINHKSTVSVERLKNKIADSMVEEKEEDIDTDYEDIMNDTDIGDDNYPKHHLTAPNEDVKDDNQANNYNCVNHVTSYTSAHQQQGYDSDDLEDPFLDDDPNDPEWKRGINERTEHARMRKKF